MAAPVILGVLLVGGLAYAAIRRWRRSTTEEATHPAPPPPERAPAPAVLALRDAIDAQWPKRGRWSDGVMGDAAHQARKSDHNEGNAIDITFDPVNGPDMAPLADAIFEDERVAYQIWQNRIRSKTIAPGEWRPYCDGKTSCNPHTRHMHISIEASKRADTRPWDLAGVGNARGEGQA